MAWAIFWPRCTKIHPRNQFLLNVVEFFLVCEENHAIEKCLTLPGLKVVYHGGVESGSEQLCFSNKRRPPGPQPHQEGM